MEDDSENFKVLTACLLQDVLRCYEALDKSTLDADFKFWARATTRAVFAAIGGMCEALCSQAFAAETHNVAAGNIALGKLSVLAGETYYVDDSGEIRPQAIRIKFLHHVLFALNSYAEAHGVSYRTSKNGRGWQSLRTGVTIRDRITHPSNAQAIELDYNDMKEVRAAFLWFYNEIAAILRETGADLPPFTDDKVTF